jgi:hypothetical protein
MTGGQEAMGNTGRRRGQVLASGVTEVIVTTNDSLRQRRPPGGSEVWHRDASWKRRRLSRASTTV